MLECSKVGFRYRLGDEWCDLTQQADKHHMGFCSLPRSSYEKCLCSIVQAQVEFAMNHNLIHTFAIASNLKKKKKKKWCQERRHTTVPISYSPEQNPSPVPHWPTTPGLTAYPTPQTLPAYNPCLFSSHVCLVFTHYGMLA